MAPLPRGAITVPDGSRGAVTVPDGSLTGW
jgi:hypothetical protein